MSGAPKLQTGDRAHNREHADTTAGRAEALAAAFEGTIDPPACVQLREEDAPYWRIVTESRAASEWIDADLLVAAELARVFRDIEALRQLLADGGLVKDSKGFLSIDPVTVEIDRLVARQLRLYRQLKMGTGLGADKLRPLRQAHAKAREHRDAINDADPDGLLARPLLNS